MMMRKTLPMMALLSALGGCGWTVGGAREAYAQKWCNYYVGCQQVGSGKHYASTDDCLTSERANALSLWPTDTCDGKINAKALDTCLTAIDSTQCNTIDQVLTLAKCTSNSVCN